MTTWTTLALTNLACLIIGYLLGRNTRAVTDIQEKLMADDTARPGGETHKQARSRLRRVHAWQVLGALVALVGIMTAVFGVVLIRNQDRLTGCVTGYSNALADTLDKRAAPQQAATEQLDRVMRAIVDAYATASAEAQVEVRRAIEAYVVARDEAKKFLAANPLPDAPRDACAELLD